MRMGEGGGRLGRTGVAGRGEKIHTRKDGDVIHR